MKRRLPPSFLFRARTAWAVVPLPAKESRTSASLSSVAMLKIAFNESVALEKSKDSDSHRKSSSVRSSPSVCIAASR